MKINNFVFLIGIISNTAHAGMFSRRIFGSAAVTCGIGSYYAWQARSCATADSNIFKFDRKNKAPWMTEEEKVAAKVDKIDISDYVPDYKLDMLVRKNSSQQILSLESSEESLFLQNVPLKPFDRLKESKHINAYKSIGLIKSIYGIGTGFLIDADLLLTAAHVVTTEVEGKQVVNDDIEFFLMHDDDTYINKVRSNKCMVPQEYISGNDPSYDFALVFLKNSISKYAISTTKIEDNIPFDVSIAGYPDEFIDYKKNICSNDVLNSYISSGSLNKVSNCTTRLFYEALTSPGMSGAPILNKNGLSCGVHTNGGQTSNSGVHAYKHMIDRLNLWLSKSENTKLKNLINELAKSPEEKKYLLYDIKLFEKYGEENWRVQIAFSLDKFRS